MPQVQFLTGILLISAKQEIIKQYFLLIGLSAKLKQLSTNK